MSFISNTSQVPLLATEEISRNHPFYAKITNRYCLNKSGSSKETWHIELDLSGAQFDYHPGDSIGILPHNPQKLIEATLERLNATGEEEIFDQKREQRCTLREFLTSRATLTTLSPKLARHLDVPKTRNPLTVLQPIDPQSYCDMLQPLLPRFYSVASSKTHVGESVHLLVATFTYAVDEIAFPGIASHYLTTTEDLVAIYPHPNPKFHVPSSDTPIIMIGPGTGLAPYRGFLQERLNSENWLFFGERNADTDFYYQEELEAHPSLTLTTAFSRDTLDKVYVQHRLREHASALSEWVARGAHIYVCGDAKSMARDVASAFDDILPTTTRELRRAGRYHTDVY